jgi:uncharacterized protein YecE (DUF72 family)
MARAKHRIWVGTAAWNLPQAHRHAFPAEGSHLERYAGRFPAVEINSSFYRPHRPSTYERWAASVPDDFRFAVKMPREITHKRRLVDIAEPLDRFLSEAGALGEKLGPLLVQLPPSLVYERGKVSAFFAALRERFAGLVACEPRHPTWFMAETEEALASFNIARAAADPAPAPGAADPGGWRGLVYVRLHGSPKMYYSPYSPERLDEVAGRLRSSAAAGLATWCIFDNTALGAATADALAVLDRLSRRR